ncbi:SpoIID/LytB domain-containing protein [Patescibacteria group bacterium]|nr:SpoIID/LytB domain-containing protein [Patescibacteria group bacterium]
MKKKISILFLSLFFFLFLNVPRSSSDELADISKQINDLTGALNESIKATKPLESQLIGLQNQIAGIKNRVAAIDQDIVVKKKSIDDGYKNLAKQQTILNKTIADYYIKSYYFSPILIFLSSGNASDLTRLLAYQRVVTNNDKVKITNIALAIQDLENRKASLEQEQQKLTVIKSDLDVQSAKLDKIVAGAKDYQSKLSGQIAQLTAQQQQIIAQKLGSLNLPKSAYTTSGGCSSDLKNGKSAGFSGGFGFFSYGVPHRVGMSQYGAKGRAEAGQSFGDILTFYFPNTQLTTVSTSTNIHVTGTNEYGQSFDDNWNIEEYVQHIYEIPTGWHSNALKAQAIAARSYALATTNNGANSICPSQSCQVVKRELNSDAWKQAVNDTSGQILTNDGKPIKAWFSSTAGGYTFGSGDIWGSGTSYTRNSLDATGSVGSFSDLQNNAYDKESPWFYCDWGSRSQYNGTAWLKAEEVADIVNVILLVRKNATNACFVYQTDKPAPAPDPNKGCSKTDNWSSDKVKQELGSGSFNSISSVSVSADFGSGRSTNVTVNGDAGSQTFSGDEFKNYFNVRAPSNINIVGPLYNVERN